MVLNHQVSRMNLDHLKTFHYVAKSGSFTQAAHLLFLTQPAVTLQIKGLENSLRVTLFDRSRKKISLTTEGKILYTYTERLFSLFDEINHVFQDLNHLQTGSLTIAATAVMGTYYLTDILKNYNKLFPLVGFKIKMGNSQQVIDWVINQEADIGLAGRVSTPPPVKQLLLHREPYTVVVGANSPLLRLRRALNIEEFLHSFVVMREKGTRTRAKIEDWFKKYSAGHQRPTPLITITSLEAAKRLVASGFGTMALPHLAVADEIASGHLIPISVENFQINADYYLTYLTNRNHSVAALQFLMLLRKLSGTPLQRPEIDKLLENKSLLHQS